MTLALDPIVVEVLMAMIDKDRDPLLFLSNIPCLVVSWANSWCYSVHTSLEPSFP